MFQYTTPTDVLFLRGINLEGFDVWVSYQQKKRELDVKVPAASVTYDSETDTTTVTAKLTQEQTGLFGVGTVEVQVNWIGPDDSRDATFIGEEEVFKNLLEKVVRYGDD